MKESGLFSPPKVISQKDCPLYPNVIPRNNKLKSKKMNIYTFVRRRK